MDSTLDLEQIIREELALATRFKDMLAKRGMTYKLIPLPMDRSTTPVVPTNGATGSGSDSRSEVADHGENKQKVLDAIRAHAGDTYNAQDIANATGLSMSAVRQVFRRLRICTEDYVLVPAQGRRPTRYSKTPLKGTLSAEADDLLPAVDSVNRVNGNGHAAPKEETL